MNKREKEKRKSSNEDYQYKMIDLGYKSKEEVIKELKEGERFTWVKKERKNKRYDKEELERREAKRKYEAQKELERLNRRRAERELEREAIEAERIRQQRAADLNQLGDWESREIQFHLTQAEKRAIIKLVDLRGEPFDYLIFNLKISKDIDFEREEIKLSQILAIPIKKSFDVIENLELEELKSILKEVELMIKLEVNEVSIEYWKDVKKGIQLIKERLEPSLSSNRIPNEVKLQINKMMKSKDYEQLNELKKKILEKLNSNLPIDNDYWEASLSTCELYLVKEKLNKFHQKVLKIRKKWLDIQQNEEAYKVQLQLQNYLNKIKESEKENQQKISNNDNSHHQLNLLPKLYPLERIQLIKNIKITNSINERELWKQQKSKTLEQIKNNGHVQLDNLIKLNNNNNNNNKEMNLNQSQSINAITLAAKLFEEERQSKLKRNEELEEDEEIFDGEAILPNNIPNSIKQSLNYEPRKPYYFNRVHTAYEWNQYNQTHYDIENPPPKSVMGYKFHIFYNELLPDPKSGKIILPTYEVVPDPLSEDTEIIVFKAGPPYLDIGFRIIKKEWEYSHKKGFKCAFKDGMLLLHFQFKRLVYRR